MYHKVSIDVQDFLTISTDQLLQQLSWIQSRFTVVRLSEVVAHVERQIPLPPNALLVTFDDGYSNNFNLAYPIFKRLNMPFSIFLVGNFINQQMAFDGEVQSFLSSNNLLEMSDLVEFGYHSSAHLNLMTIDPDEWENEIQNGIQSVAHLPISIQKTWAYTFGKFPKKDKVLFDRLQTIFKNQKIACAFRIGNRKNSLPIKNKYAIERLDIRGNQSFLKFKLKVRFGKIFAF